PATATARAASTYARVAARLSGGFVAAVSGTGERGARASGSWPSDGRMAVTAAYGLTTPQPYSGCGSVPAGWSAVSSMRRTTCATESRGWYARTSATTPATYGAAKLVPWLVTRPSPPAPVLIRSWPGATRSTPTVSENWARLPAGSIAPTDSTPG